MPIKVVPECKHCGKEIQQDEPFGQWYHSAEGFGNTIAGRRCERFNPNSTLAIAKVMLVKRGES